MYRYFIKTPWWVRKLFSSYKWRIPVDRKVVYLTFDDGPHATITPWVLDELKKYNAAATFFCIGNNVAQQPVVYARIVEEGHAIGNHTNQHVNGWKTPTKAYLEDVADASQWITTNLFRPPYGRITPRQAKGLAKAMQSTSPAVIMWDVLSGDFDSGVSSEECIKNVLENVSPGSIVVFHDSVKAFNNLKLALPKVIKSLAGKGYRFEKIVVGGL